MGVLFRPSFYRQWSQENLPKEEAEQTGIEILTSQIEIASNEKKDVMIMGDANLCSLKWSDPNFMHKKIANQLKNCLLQNGLTVEEVGKSFVADHMQIREINYYYYYYYYYYYL